MSKKRQFLGISFDLNIAIGRVCRGPKTLNFSHLIFDKFCFSDFREQLLTSEKSEFWSNHPGHFFSDCFSFGLARTSEHIFTNSLLTWKFDLLSQFGILVVGKIPMSDWIFVCEHRWKFVWGFWSPNFSLSKWNSADKWILLPEFHLWNEHARKFVSKIPALVHSKFSV